VWQVAYPISKALPHYINVFYFSYSSDLHRLYITVVYVLKLERFGIVCASAGFMYDYSIQKKLLV
jgi:hypothetical protein